MRQHIRFAPAQRLSGPAADVPLSRGDPAAKRGDDTFMTFDDWDKDGAGRLKVWPLQAFTTAVFDGKAGGVRLEVGVPKPGLPAPAVQISLTPDLLRALARALDEVADTIAGTAGGPRGDAGKPQ